MRDSGGLQNDFVGGFGDGFRSVDRGGVRKLDVRNEVAFVLLRDESHGGFQKAVAGESEQAEVEDGDDGGDPGESGHSFPVTVADEFKDGVESPEEPAEEKIEQFGEGVFLGAGRLEQDGRERGAQGHGVEGGNDGGDGDGQRELPVEFP